MEAKGQIEDNPSQRVLTLDDPSLSFTMAYLAVATTTFHVVIEGHTGILKCHTSRAGQGYRGILSAVGRIFSLTLVRKEGDSEADINRPNVAFREVEFTGATEEEIHNEAEAYIEEKGGRIITAI